MTDCMQFLTPEMNLRQFDDFRFVEAIFHIINFSSRIPSLDRVLLSGLEKQLRICIEIYLSKIRDPEQLLSLLDYLMSSI